MGSRDTTTAAIGEVEDTHYTPVHKSFKNQTIVPAEPSLQGAPAERWKRWTPRACDRIEQVAKVTSKA